MTHSFRPHPFRSDLTILLIADSPPAEPRTGFQTPLARREALISVARATFAAGGRLAVPLDVDAALLIGTLALDYQEPRAAEQHGEPPVPRVTVMQNGSTSEPARRLLAPLGARGAIRLVDEQGEGVVLDASPEAEIDGLSDVSRHMLTSSMVQAVQPTFAVLINPESRVSEEASVLREGNVPTFSFSEGALDDEAPAWFTEFGVEDPTRRLLEGTTQSPWQEEDVEPGSGYRVPPYAYLMQRLIAERLDMH